MSYKKNGLDLGALEHALKGVNIPACPAVLVQIMDELNSPDASDRRIAALIGEDVGIASLVVRSANSPLFSRGKRIASVADAARLLGFGTVTNLVQEALLRSAIAVEDVSLERFWDNSRITAAANARLARSTGTARPETAYTFGLFHDCGIPLLIQRFDGYKAVLARANTCTEGWFTAVEDEAFGTNHAIIGYFLARTWGLNDAVSLGILCHHDYSIFDGHNDLGDATRTLVAINAIGEHVASTHLRTRNDTDWSKARAPVAHYLSLTLAELDDLADDLIYEFDRELDAESA